MEIRHLQTFVQVAQNQSFSKAAKELGYSQAAVTIQIQQLEEELQTRLFERFNKTIRLSEQGTLFLVHAQEILQAVECAKTSVKEHDDVEGILRIGTIESLCTSLFPALLLRYQSQYPNVTIMLETASPKALLDSLKQNRLDLVYLLDQPIVDLSLSKLLDEQEEVIVVCSMDHPLADQTSLNWQELAQQRWLLTEANASYRCALSELLARHSIAIAPVLEAGNTDLIISLLKQNAGISFLPKSVLEQELCSGTLVQLQPFKDTCSIHRQLLKHKHKWMTSCMHAFVQMLEQEHHSHTEDAATS